MKFPTYRRLSINGKLMLLILSAGGVAVLFSSAAFMVNDLRTMRNSTVRQLSALAEVIGANCIAAMEFEDAAAAADTLASLKLQQPVEFACLFDARGEIFSTYRRNGVESPLPAHPPGDGHEFTASGHIDVVQPIERDGKRLGVIYLRAGRDELREQIARQALIAILVMIVSLGTAVAFSVRLLRAISRPILSLAETAERISRERDYSIRVHADSADELGVLYGEFNGMLAQIQTGEQALQVAHDELEIKVVERTSQLSEVVEKLNAEVAERVRAETELKDLHSQLMDTARRAGMAEIATGVLHNIGNVLNSINVSASVAADRLRGARIGQLGRAVEMIEQHREDLPVFLISDPKGSQIPGFLRILSTHLNDEQTAILKELENLTTKIDHVKTIVATQQSYAGVSGIIEEFDVSSAIDDALKLNSTAFDRLGIKIVREYEPLRKVVLDKQKLLQILVNLVKNGKDALVSSKEMDRHLTFRTQSNGPDRLRIQVCDNGVGIRPEHLTKIFTHGFTTKHDGHGFGLHSCANAAKELGGALSVISEGPGRGATFLLELPFRSHHEPRS